MKGLFSDDDLAAITEIRQDSHSWQALDHDLRDEYFEAWEDSNTRTELLQDHESGDWTVRLASIETRDGFIEVYDADWNRIARLVDGDGLTADDIEAEYPGFAAAWAAVQDFTPSEFRPDPGQDLKFTIGEWDEVMVFDANGQMIGALVSGNMTMSGTIIITVVNLLFSIRAQALILMTRTGITLDVMRLGRETT